MESERGYLTRRGRKRRHLAEVRGWLGDGDAFFQAMERIVAHRRRHRPRPAVPQLSGRQRRDTLEP